MLRSWSDRAWITPLPAPTATSPHRLKRTLLSIPRHLPTPTQPASGGMYEPTHLAVYRGAVPGTFAVEPAYTSSTAVPPLGSQQQVEQKPAKYKYGLPYPDPAIMTRPLMTRGEDYHRRSKYEKKAADFEIKAYNQAIEDAKKFETQRAKKAAALQKKAEKEEKKARQEALKRAEERAKAARKAQAKAMKEALKRPWLYQQQQQRKRDPDPQFWNPGTGFGYGYGDSAYRRPLENGDGWPLMSRTMTQAVHDYDYEDRLVRAANGQIIGFGP